MDHVNRCERSDVPEQSPLLVGRLYLRQTSYDARPALEVSVWCPWCHLTHLHPWPDPPVQAGEAVEVAARCRGGEGERFYYVALDPTHSAHNNRTAKLADAAFADWERRQAGEEAQVNGH